MIGPSIFKSSEVLLSRRIYYRTRNVHNVPETFDLQYPRTFFPAATSEKVSRSARLVYETQTVNSPPSVVTLPVSFRGPKSPLAEAGYRVYCSLCRDSER